MSNLFDTPRGFGPRRLNKLNAKFARQRLAKLAKRAGIAQQQP